ncbi:hypothetical protein BST61_g7729 [Cercospora zeina]
MFFNTAALSLLAIVAQHPVPIAALPRELSERGSYNVCKSDWYGKIVPLLENYGPAQAFCLKKYSPSCERATKKQQKRRRSTRAARTSTNQGFDNKAVALSKMLRYKISCCLYSLLVHTDSQALYHFPDHSIDQYLYKLLRKKLLLRHLHQQPLLLPLKPQRQPLRQAQLHQLHQAAPQVPLPFKHTATLPYPMEHLIQGASGDSQYLEFTTSGTPSIFTISATCQLVNQINGQIADIDAATTEGPVFFDTQDQNHIQELPALLLRSIGCE